MSAPTIVSAADARYFRCLLQLLRSVDRHHGRASLRRVVYDLGLSSVDRARLTRDFPGWELRRFSFSGLPAHVAIRPRPTNTNAWKPLIVAEVLASCVDAPLVWLDSATVLLRPLDELVRFTERTGLYTPFGGGSTLGELTDSRVLDTLGASAELRSLRQRASGVFAADPRSAHARALVQDWAKHALDPACIAPEGATLAHHRFDQSLLNVLLYQRASQHALELTDDEIDVSSARPSSLYRTRNKVPRSIPLALDPLVRAWFAGRRALDVAIIRGQRGVTRAPSARTASGTSPR